MDELDRRIPRGLGKGGIAGRGLLMAVLTDGARAAVDDGFGTADDLERCEERGTSPGAEPDLISDHALSRGGGRGR